MNKVRFVGGPFGGRVFKTNEAGKNELIFRGPKKMTREEQWQHRTSQPYMMPYRPPQVEARYKIAMRLHTNGYNVSNMPCMHPDGSLFYEYVEGSKREY